MLLGSNLASVTDLKRFQIINSLCCDFGGDKTFTTCWSSGRTKFESKFEPLQFISGWQSLQRLSQKVIEGLEGKIDGQALGAALLHCLGKSDGQAQTQDISKSAVVAAGSDLLA